MSAFEGTSFGEYEGELKEMLEKAQGAGAADIIAECQDLISQMKLEMRTMPKDEKAAAATAIQGYEGQLQEAESALLLGGGGGGAAEEAPVDTSDRGRMQATTDRLEEQQTKLSRARDLVADIEETGEEIVSELAANREKIEATQAKVDEANQNMDKANTITGRMGKWFNGGKAQRARPLAWLARPPPAASSVRSVKVTGCLRWLSSVASQRLRTRSGRYARAARSDKCVSTHMEVHLSIKIHNEKPHREGARGPSVGPASSRGGESSCRLSSARKRVGTLLHMRVEFLVELILEMAELVMEVLERALKRRHGRARIVCRLHPHEEPVVQWVRDLIRRKPDVAVVEQLLPHEVADSVVLLFDDRRAAVLGLLESLVRNLNLIVVH
eukprot:CAMPEP_0119484446 /NCGR_PEP_ID=MMETSP1344-20130328/11456_1 /TAXON_ID=236787 /ORGANISM="Florenciella parvula, Strain CCMP2471" /LENGTH=384 /DNA_ID=CAMNT_0007519027 /DNA_START=34 /DNA_END=1189 /DNA_ORIENTATION=-